MTVQDDGAVAIPVWDGNANNLPPMEEPFIYNGKMYAWSPCPCEEPNCKRPTVVTEGQTNFEMTVRLRGLNQGDPVANVLCKMGFMEQLIEVGNCGGSIPDLFNTMLSTLPVRPFRDPFFKIEEFLTSKGSSFGEMKAALDELYGGAF